MNGYVHASAALLWGKDVGTHLLGGWVGPRDGLDSLENSVFFSVGIRIPDFEARSLVIIPTEPCWLLNFK
jgi:hypothetical protein